MSLNSKDNLSAVLHGPNDIRLENTPIPETNGNDVLIRIAQVGICGTDISMVRKGKIGQLVLKSPMITGHEASGTVLKCGSKVKHLKPGDRVCIEPSVPCLACDLCRQGHYNVCPNAYNLSLPPHDGCLMRYYKHDANFCYKLPDNVSDEEGALIEPLTVGIYACKRANLQLGSHVLVCGAGPIGLVTLIAAQAMGATKICVIDILEERLKFAKELGADSVLNVKDGTNEENAKKVINLLGGDMADVTFDCSGAESAIKLGITVTKSCGKVILVGLGPPEVKIPLVDAAMREVDIIGALRYVNNFPTAIDMISSGKVNVKPLISHRFKLEETQKAFQLALKNDGKAAKIMISC